MAAKRRTSSPERRVPKTRRKKEHPKVIDLFAGPGGLSLGAARAGFAICAAAELDSKAMATHRKNFPRTIHLEMDVAGLCGRGLRAALGLSDGSLGGIVGGPPCQGFSCIGRNDKDDRRNDLFVDFFRIVSEAAPKFFLAENVPGIMNDKNVSIRQTAFSFVEDDYVLLPPMTLAANEYGAPTVRTRVFFFGFRNDEMKPLSPDNFRPPEDAESVRVRDALRGLPIKINPNWQREEEGWRVARSQGDGYFASRLHGHVPADVADTVALRRLRKESRASGSLGTRHSKEVAKRYAKIKPGKRDPVSKSHRLEADGFCPTIRAGTGPDRGRFQAVRPLHPTENRVITPREAARLQGFPDWFQFSPTKWHSFRQIGSSVSPILAERILVVIRKALGDEP